MSNPWPRKEMTDHDFSTLSAAHSESFSFTLSAREGLGTYLDCLHIRSQLSTPTLWANLTCVRHALSFLSVFFFLFFFKRETFQQNPMIFSPPPPVITSQSLCCSLARPLSQINPQGVSVCVCAHTHTDKWCLPSFWTQRCVFCAQADAHVPSGERNLFKHWLTLSSRPPPHAASHGPLKPVSPIPGPIPQWRLHFQAPSPLSAFFPHDHLHPQPSLNFGSPASTSTQWGDNGVAVCGTWRK